MESSDTETSGEIRHNWQHQEILDWLSASFNDLLHAAHTTHRRFHAVNKIQISALLSIKTGACPEDCAYCPQSVHYDTGLKREKLMSVDEITSNAQLAKEKGAERFCMGAAWRSPSNQQINHVGKAVAAVKALGLESCATLGMLSAEQAQSLSEAGLDYYNHNLDTSPAFYGRIITTRTYRDRLKTLQHVRDAGIKVCCGGIVGMGESRNDRAGLLQQLANLPQHPESVPVNQLVRVRGTPLQDVQDFDPLEMVRTIAAARIIMPKAWVRLSAGREEMSDELQALCFFAGANSVFYGDQLLTAANAPAERDQGLFKRLGLNRQALN